MRLLDVTTRAAGGGVAAVRLPRQANGLTAIRMAETMAGAMGLAVAASRVAATAAMATAAMAGPTTVTTTATIRIRHHHHMDTGRATSPTEVMEANSRTSNPDRTEVAEAGPPTAVGTEAADTAGAAAAGTTIRTAATVRITSRTTTTVRHIIREAMVAMDKEVMVVETEEATVATAVGDRAATVAEAKEEDADVVGTTTLVGVGATVDKHTIKVVTTEATDKGHTAITVAGTTIRVGDASGRWLL